MQLSLHWNQAMQFTGSSGGNTVAMDAKSPIGQGTAMTPKELVVAGLAGCTAMDVAALFKKHKQTPNFFNMNVDVETSTSGHPVVFTKATLNYIAEGDISKDIFIEAVTLSQTKYCGVSAMLSKALPIFYKITLNNEVIHEGQSHFAGY